MNVWARTLRDRDGMWVDEAQRERIFEMVGTRSVTFHRVRNARAEQHRRLVIAGLLAAAAVWMAIATT